MGLPEHVHLGDQKRLRQDRHLLRPAGGAPSHEEQGLVGGRSKGVHLGVTSGVHRLLVVDVGVDVVDVVAVVVMVLS